MGHKCKVRGRRTRPVSSPPHPRFRSLTSCCRVCPHLNLREVWSPQCAQCPTPLSRQELKRKLESAEDSDIVEQGKVTLKSVKKELRLLQKAEEEQNQGEGARSLPLCILLPLPTPVLAPHGPYTTLRTHSAGAVAAMVERLGEAHDEALGEIEEREKHFVALFGDGDDEILSSPGL